MEYRQSMLCRELLETRLCEVFLEKHVTFSKILTNTCEVCNGRLGRRFRSMFPLGCNLVAVERFGVFLGTSALAGGFKALVASTCPLFVVGRVASSVAVLSQLRDLLAIVTQDEGKVDTRAASQSQQNLGSPEFKAPFRIDPIGPCW